MKKPKVGDVVEIVTNIGLAYGHLTHQHEQYGSLLRVYGLFRSSRPDIADCLASDKLQFLCFYPLWAAIKQGAVSIVGNVPISDDEKEFPVFRAGIADPSTGQVEAWWLWDGNKEWMIGALEPKHRKYPIRGVWNHTFLLQRLESGWQAQDVGSE